MRLQKPQRSSLLVLLALCAAGCGDKLLGIAGSIAVSPSQLDFGSASVGSPQSISVSISNQGSAALLIEAIKVASDPNNELSVASLLTVDCAGSPRNGGTTLSPGECARFTANWTPTAPHAAAGAIEVDSSDMQSPVVTLPVSGTAVVSGCYPNCTSSQACCGDVCVDTQSDPSHCGGCSACQSGASCNGGTCVTPTCGSTGDPNPVLLLSAGYSTSQSGGFTGFDPTMTPSPVAPLDWLQVSVSTTTGSGPFTYQWSITSQPSGSAVTLSGATGATVTFQALVSGDYTLAVKATDGASCSGTASVTIHVVPKGNVHIELTWGPCGDLDLHYVDYTDSGNCNSGDCAYYNPRTAWGATLDHDSLWGGNENITQTAAADGTPYQIWVYYYSTLPDGGGGAGQCGAMIPTVNVYFNGNLAKTYTLSNGLTAGQGWHVADVSVSSASTQYSVAQPSGSPVIVNNVPDPCSSDQ